MGVEAELNKRVQAGALRADAEQSITAAKLDELLEQMQTYKPKRTLRGWASAPNGLYIWGGVGRGKSMLMDMFFDAAPTRPKSPTKSRVHFHAFMQDIHRRIGAWRKLSPKKRRAQPNYVRGAGDDPIAPTAKAIASEATLLCFDEFHVTDITDAMILSRLFTALLARGVVIVATSNRAPDELYKDGLNRKLFLPFIELLKQKLDVLAMGGDEDHRLRKFNKAPMYYSPLGAKADAGIEAIWQRLIKPNKPQMQILKVQGREISLLAATGTARADFADLCDRALGAADYLMIAKSFTTLILENVPIMSLHNRNEAKRFVTLIDTLYEHKTKLVLSADATPDKLYDTGDGAFEFERTTSRLMEMRSDEYIGQEHITEYGLETTKL
ncbi:MAG: AFG1 family ATPase [Robiginitomaculum sp.]|nr:AFG1 family ATPase [Robiginitomaculum sp.]